MAGPCLNDTNSIELELNDDLELEANLLVDPTGPIQVGAGGTTLALHETMEVLAGGLALNYQGDNISHDANGFAVVNGNVRTGTALTSDDTTTHSSAINRAATAVVGSTLSLDLVNATTEGVTFNFMAHWGGVYQTNFPALDGFGNIVDSVAVFLQVRQGAGAFYNADWASLNTYNLAMSFSLHSHELITVGSGQTVTMQARLLTSGGSTSGTARQGVLNRSYRRWIQATW